MSLFRLTSDGDDARVVALERKIEVLVGELAAAAANHIELVHRVVELEAERERHCRRCMDDRQQAQRLAAAKPAAAEAEERRQSFLTRASQMPRVRVRLAQKTPGGRPYIEVVISKVPRRTFTIDVIRGPFYFEDFVPAWEKLLENAEIAQLVAAGTLTVEAVPVGEVALFLARQDILPDVAGV